MTTQLNILRFAMACGSGGLRNFATTQIVGRSAKVNQFNLNFDRRIKVDYKDSIRYMNSETYKKIYGDGLVFDYYRRNHRSLEPSERTRPNCINDEGFLMTSYPCSVCRDEYLVLHHENIKLLNQFIDPFTGALISTKKHGLCLKQYRKLIISIHKAKDFGLMTHELPDRLYDYKEYYGDEIPLN